MRPSTVLAAQHFRNKVLPRKITDERPDEKNGRKKQNRINHAESYRKAKRDETGGDLFSLSDFSFDSLAQFGLGVSVYLIQLGIVGLVTFLCGCILLPSIVSFASSSYGEFWKYDLRLLGSAACQDQVIVQNITQGCGQSETSCAASYRADCEIPEATIIADIVMSCFLLLVLYFNMGIDEVEDVLDEAVQTAQDYSIVVDDPDGDATDPEEWRVFFERYGRVRNVTITKKNRHLHHLLLTKHLIMREIDPKVLPKVRDEMEFSVAVNNLKSRSATFDTDDIIHENESWWLYIKQSLGFCKDMFYYIKKLCAVNRQLDMASQVEYPACRVFVSFETEKEQRLCLRECATSYLEAIFDISSGTRSRTKFRDSSVLSLSESAEPNNIQWENLESSIVETLVRRTLCWLFSLSFIIALFFAITFVMRTYPTMVSILISVINICLPSIFIAVTEFEAHIDEDNRQNSLLFKLYGAKLLTSVIFLYISTSWDTFLDSASIIAIINVQIGACFSAPLFKLFDPMGVLNRWIIGPALATSQSELNTYWEGSAFMLADRYTEISKVIFISFFYSLLTPMALFIAVLSCVFMFAVDRYLLFRVTKTPPMLDATMAKSLREHSLFAIGVKVWLSCRFVYSWPMDGSYLTADNVFVKVNKVPSFSMWTLQEEVWHSASQKHLLIVYKWVAMLIMGAVILVIFVGPVVNFTKAFLYSSLEEEESGTSDKPYSRVASMIAYCPIIKNKTEAFIVADTSRMLTRHTPEVISCFPGEETNLGLLLKEADRARLLARVVWCGEADVVADLEANNDIVEEGKAEKMGTRGILSSAFSRRFGAAKKDQDGHVMLTSNYRLVDRAIKNKLSITVGNDLADVAHIDMVVKDDDEDKDKDKKEDYDDEESKHQQDKDEGHFGAKGVENILGMSRIKKSILQRSKNNKIDVAPKPEMKGRGKERGSAETCVFMRDEVYLLRQMRKEMLSVNVIQSKGNTDSAFVDFNKFLFLVQKNSPAAILSPRKARNVANLRDSCETKDQNIKLSRTLLRRIFVKFLPLQESLGSTNKGGEHLLDWPIFVAFVQSGTAVELASLHD
jgi:hypothetical protein